MFYYHGSHLNFTSLFYCYYHCYYHISIIVTITIPYSRSIQSNLFKKNDKNSFCVPGIYCFFFDM